MNNPIARGGHLTVKPSPASPAMTQIASSTNTSRRSDDQTDFATLIVRLAEDAVGETDVEAKPVKINETPPLEEPEDELKFVLQSRSSELFPPNRTLVAKGDMTKVISSGDKLSTLGLQSDSDQSQIQIGGITPRDTGTAIANTENVEIKRSGSNFKPVLDANGNPATFPSEPNDSRKLSVKGGNSSERFAERMIHHGSGIQGQFAVTEEAAKLDGANKARREQISQTVQAMLPTHAAGALGEGAQTLQEAQRSEIAAVPKQNEPFLDSQKLANTTRQNEAGSRYLVNLHPLLADGAENQTGRGTASVVAHTASHNMAQTPNSKIRFSGQAALTEALLPNRQNGVSEHSFLLQAEVHDILSWDSPRTSHALNTAANPLRGDIAPHMARQLAEIFPQAMHRPTEITLSPQELGRVRMSVNSDDGVITVNIIAERTDTLDLMRRHIDQLGQSFREMGYESITFSFGQHSDADTQTDGEGKKDDGTRNTDAPNLLVDQPENNLIQLDSAVSAGVDIRL